MSLGHLLLLNMLSGKAFTLPGMVTAVISLHEEKAFPSIVVTEFGIVMLPVAVRIQARSVVLLLSAYTKIPST